MDRWIRAEEQCLWGAREMVEWLSYGARTYSSFIQKTHAQFPPHPWWLTTYPIPVPGDLTSGLQGTAFMWYTSIHAHKKTHLQSNKIKLNFEKKNNVCSFRGPTLNSQHPCV